MNVQILNPSPFHPLRIFTQDRLRNATVNAPTAAPLPKRETREQILARGVEMTTKACRGTVNEGGVLRSVERDVPMQAWQAGGWETLSQYITETMERQLREQQAAAATAAMIASNGGARVQHVVDEWGEPHPMQLVPPGAKVVLPLAEERRLVIECPEDEVGLQIQNESHTRTLRLRNRDSKTGATSHSAFAAPLQVSLVIANGKSSAVVELMPS